jgi:hypothetical protein
MSIIQDLSSKFQFAAQSLNKVITRTYVITAAIYFWSFDEFLLSQAWNKDAKFRVSDGTFRPAGKQDVDCLAMKCRLEDSFQVVLGMA